jgi:hypothetical protein
MSNLRLLNETTADTSTTSLEITDVFSSDFDIYKIVSTLHIVNDSDDIYIRYINSAGTKITASNYDTATLMMRSFDSFLERPITRTNINYGGYFTLTSGDEGGGVVEYVFNPTNTSSYTFGLNQSQGFLIGTGSYGTKSIRVLKQTNSITGVCFYNGNGTDNFGGGTVKIYGLRVDS